MKSQAFRDNVDDMFMVTAALAKYSVSWTYYSAVQLQIFERQLLGVSHRNYYSAVRRNEQLEPDPQHDELIEWVQKIADASDYTYGVRRMKRALNSLGYPVGKQRTRALMKEADVSVRRRRKHSWRTSSFSKSCDFWAYKFSERFLHSWIWVEV